MAGPRRRRAGAAGGATDPGRGVSDAREPTLPPPQPGSLNRALERNIAALRQRAESERGRARFDERLAATITGFTGSIRFVYLHLALFGFWIVANLGWIPGIRQWDPSFVILAMAA